MARVSLPLPRAALAAWAALLLAGCVAVQPPSVSVAALYERPAERALINGLRSYEEGAFERAETQLRRALKDGLANSYDVAVANKYLAFIACAFNRLPACEQHFRDAFRAENDFTLTDKEVGHPIWGPVYQRVRAAQKR